MMIYMSMTQKGSKISFQNIKLMKKICINNRDEMILLFVDNIAYIMAKHADPSIPDTPQEWLYNFNTFSIYQVLPKIIELWGLNVQTDVQSKKNFAQLNAR